MFDFIVQQIHKDGKEEEINGAKENNRREDCIGFDHGGKAGRGSQQSLDDPGLPPHFRGEPTRLIGDLRAEHRQHKQPQQPTLFKQRPAPELEKAEG